MAKITASNLISEIKRLPEKRLYNYVNPKTATKIEIVHISLPEGPIRIKRHKRDGSTDDVSISTEMIWRLANALSNSQLINFDRVFGASYNTRSALEALIAHTPEFFACYPGRVEETNITTEIKKGHKHILWKPESPHELGKIEVIEINTVISEVSTEIFYDNLEVKPDNTEQVSIDIERRHAQIQIALIMIGHQLGFRTWVAKNDKGIVYQNKKLGEMEEVIKKLEDEPLLSSFQDAVKSALLIDCIWFRNNKFMPAVMEVEHSTGVTSGLSRMKNFYDNIPRFQDVRWAIVAPDRDRNKVFKEASKEQFKDLDTKFFPYSAVEELYSLCKRRKLKGVNDEFLDCFMEPCLQ